MIVRLLVCALVAAVVPQVRAAGAPNVLLICVDDLKPALGCYGDPLAKTPNIDRLAARAIRFDRAYCNQAVCSPSRNALLTGLRPHRTGIYDLPTNFRVATPDAITLPQHFKANKYQTEALGKIFHVGHGNHEDPASWSVPHWRADGSNYALAENREPPGQGRQRRRNAGARANNQPRGPAYESADVPDSAYPDGAMANEAVRRLKAAAKAGTPFFVATGFLKPHLPFCAPQKYWDMHEASAFKLAGQRTPPEGAPPYAPTTWGELRNYRGMPKQGAVPDDEQRKLIHGYYAATSYMDAQVGKVLQALEDAGLAESTIVVFWGDHGWHLGDHGMWCKHSNYEQAARIPLLIAAPKQIRPGVTKALAESVDIYPTLCELAGLDVPAGLDGQSLVANLKEPQSAGQPYAMHVFPRGERLGRAVRTERHRLVEWKTPGASDDTAEFELYDYVSDPAETKNLAREQPQVVAELRTLLGELGEAAAPKDAANSGDRPKRRARVGT